MLNEVINFMNEGIFSINFLGESEASLPLDLLGVLPELFLFVVISTLLIVGASYSTSSSSILSFI